MSVSMSVALLGDVENPLSPRYEDFFEREWSRPYSERRKVELEVDENELLGQLMERAAEAFGVELPADEWASPISFIAFYKPEDEKGFHGWSSTVTLVDARGRAVWNVYWKDVPYSELLRAAQAGALDGDPQRPYLILHAEIGNGLLADWTTLVNLWDLTWHILEGMGVLGGAYAVARPVFERLRDRIRRGRESVHDHADDWQSRGGDPATLAAFLAQRPSSTQELSGLLGCSDSQAEAILWSFGFAQGDDGRWRAEADDDAKVLRATWELIVFGFSQTELEPRLHRLFDLYANTGRPPRVEWPEAEIVEVERDNAESET